MQRPSPCRSFADGRPSRARDTSRLARFALVVLLVTGLSACSSKASSASSPQDFRSAYANVLADYRNHFATLQSQAKGVLGKDLSTQLDVFDKLATLTHDTSTRLDALQPPAAVKSLFDQLRTSMAAQESALRTMVSAGRSGDQNALNQALREYATALQNGASLQREVESASPTQSPS